MPPRTIDPFSPKTMSSSIFFETRLRTKKAERFRVGKMGGHGEDSLAKEREMLSRGAASLRLFGTHSQFHTIEKSVCADRKGNFPLPEWIFLL